MNILGSKWVTIENETDMFSPLCFMQDILLLMWLFKAEGIPYPFSSGELISHKNKRKTNQNRRWVPDINCNYIQKLYVVVKQISYLNDTVKSILKLLVANI